MKIKNLQNLKLEQANYCYVKLKKVYEVQKEKKEEEILSSWHGLKLKQASFKSVGQF